MSLTAPPLRRPRDLAATAAPLGLAAAILWACWSSLREMQEVWATDPRYQHGYLVPLFPLYLLWLRREKLAALEWKPAAWGLALVALGAAMQLAGARYYVRWLSGAAIVPYLAGLAALVGGWPLLKLTWAPAAFLVFMIPLPYRVEVGLRAPLQAMATTASSYALQTVGLPAVQEGNVIHINDVNIGVVEACSGLSMLMTFFALSTAVALVTERRLVDKVAIVASAVPIAIVTNIARITVTGILHETAGHELADKVFHDLAGWLMMPVGLGFLWLEFRLLENLLLEPRELPTAAQLAYAVDDLRGRRAPAPAAAGKKNAETTPDWPEHA